MPLARFSARPLCRLLLVLASILFLAPQGRAEPEGWPRTVTDSAGRSVVISAPPEHILLGSGFNLVALSLIDPDPVARLAGWSQDMKNDNPEIYARFVKRFPDLASVPEIGAGDGPDLNIETILSLKADLAILASWQVGNESGDRAMQYLSDMGVPVIVADFGHDPLQGTPQTMRMLGQALGQEEKAEDFARFYEDHIDRIRARVSASASKGPDVLFLAFPRTDTCCWAFGRDGLGAFIELAGARNVVADGLQPFGGTIGPETIIAANPDTLIVSGSPGAAYSSLSIGPGVAIAEARQSLEATAAMPALAHIKAVKDRKVHAIWNFFNAVPLNVVLADAFAHWLRPDLFSDQDPSATLDEINRRFAAVPFEGAYWVDLASDPAHK
ncbi:iron complex transport system substrate-binding protein [Rhizobium sp. RU20A]|uniref:ABC transporter substrate-binding protein n=1 Tax=Rhizobium sp. RU20A TaxID=1907412 RepID=UPI000955A1F7|nr:ABC transporter substrate-binding protein [Rhizobium sp. RU20A]SIQ24163.1 iron complex transport system substrate-binding protein [Rhizobium sp. RU20A]